MPGRFSGTLSTKNGLDSPYSEMSNSNRGPYLEPSSISEEITRKCANICFIHGFRAILMKMKEENQLKRKAIGISVNFFSFSVINERPQTIGRVISDRKDN